MGIPERLGPPLAVPAYGEREIGTELIKSSYGDALFVMTGELVPYMDVIPLGVGHFQWTQVVDDPYEYLHTDAVPVCALYVPAGSTTLVTNREDDEQNMILRCIKPRNRTKGSDRQYFERLDVICGADVYVRSNSRGEPHFYVPGGSLTDQFVFEEERVERHLPYGIMADCVFKTPDTRYDFFDLRGFPLPEQYVI